MYGAGIQEPVKVVVNATTGGITLTATVAWRSIGSFCFGAECRPAGADLIFGGAGTPADVARNAIGDATLGADGTITDDPTGHARDADVIAGDNAQIFRLVGINGTAGPGTTGFGIQSPNGFLQYVYDQTSTAEDRGSLRIIPRAVQFLDYTMGGSAYNAARAATDRGRGDEIHGEAGDDQIYGMTGNDVLFGDGQDDDLIGGYGDDWISGGTGDDGILGDDGRLSTSRNSSSGWTATGIACSGPVHTNGFACYSEPLYGITALLAGDAETRISNGNVLNEEIYTPGRLQVETINVGGVLNKVVNLTPFNVDPVQNPLFRPDGGYDDIIFGGLGDDALHGGSGDDAMTGAEALVAGWAPTYTSTCDSLATCLVRIDFGHPVNPGDVLRWNPEDPDGWHFDRTRRAGEFALYDEYDPRREIVFDDLGRTWGCIATIHGGHLCSESTSYDDFQHSFFLNNVTDEGPDVDGCISFLPNGTCVDTGFARTDGNDVVFGDLGNDWLVGGTGHDTLWGGWGNDLLQADDVLTTNGSLNDVPDTHPMYEDRAFGGAGRDVLIGNTGGDRLIDWTGEFNSYIVPFAPFGAATVSRQVPPALYEFLYKLSAAQGADPTRSADNNLFYLPRNGEPYGEIGLIIQHDGILWRNQAGAPTDPQAGNIPGGRRDVLRTANFNDGTLTGFAPDSGIWQVTGAALSVSAESLGQDAAAVFYLDEAVSTYFEILAQVRVVKPTAGWKANAYIIFDYFSPTDFKFAGLDVALNKAVLGRRTAEGWIIDAQGVVQGGVMPDLTYGLQVIVNGLWVTVLVNGVAVLSRQMSPRFIDGRAEGFNLGMVGVGSDNSRGTFDDVTVQVLPPQSTFDDLEDFEDGTANLFTGVVSGTWAVTGGRYMGTASGAAPAISTMALPVRAPSDSYVELEALVRLATGGYAGLVFDQYAVDDFKFAALDLATQRVVIGHVAHGVWKVDAVFARSLAVGADLRLKLGLDGSTVSVYLDGGLVGSFSYNAPILDGGLGTLVRTGTSSFDGIRTTLGTHLVTAVDPEPPTLTLPPNISIQAAPGSTTVFVSDATIGTATATDNVPGVVVTRSGVPAGNLFPIGVTTITWTATDVFGNQTVGAQTVTITAPSTTPVVSLAVTQAAGSEQGRVPIVFTVSRAGSTASTLAVSLNWGGTAANGTDYSISVSGGTLSANRQTLTFAAGSTSATVTITPIDDTSIEPTETVTLAVAAGKGYTLGALASGSGSIADNDVALPAVTIGATSGAEGGNPVVFTLTRTGSTSGTLAVSVITGGTATAGDVGAPSIVGGTWSGSVVTFNAGSSTVSITYAVVNDTTVEPTETLTMTFASGAGYTVGSPSSATANIVDNDVAPVLPTVTVAATSGGEGGSPVVITLTRTGSTATTLAVSVSTGGTASAGDLLAAVVGGGTWNGTNTVTFAVGSSTVTLTFAVVDDALVEALETYVMTVASGAGYTVGSPSSTTANITDNDVAPVLPTLAVGDVTVVEGNNGGPTVYATITVTRSGDTSGTSSVNWTTVAGTAAAGSDFVSASGVVTFAAGQTSKTFTVQIGSDKKAEPTETFTIVLSGVTGATIADGTGVVTITDNDGAIFAASAGLSTSVAPLTDADVAAVLPAAIRQWIGAGASANVLAGMTILIGDLAGTKLADTLGSTITIDVDAAGWGWNLTPGVTDGTRIDLLSVLLHEIGHVLGYEHTTGGLMAEAIEPGTQLWTTFHSAVAAIPAIAVAPAAPAVRAITRVVPVDEIVPAVDRLARGAARVASPAVRTVAASLDLRPTPLPNGPTRPWNVPVAPTLMAAFGLLALLRRRRVI